MVLLNGPVKNALFLSYWTGTLDRYIGPVPACLRLVHGKELPVSKGWNSRLPTWEPQVTIARNMPVPRGWNSWFPNLRTRGYHCKDSQRLEFMLPNLRTIGYHCKELPIPKAWN